MDPRPEASTSWADLCEMAREELDLDPSGWTPDTTLPAAGLDSLAALELILALEERGGFRFPDELLDSVRTLGDLWAWADARSSRAASA